MSNKRILIADDEPLTRQSLYEILKLEGYSVSCAADGREALSLVEANHPDIVISDLKMPKLGGLELLREVKAIDGNISVLLMTGYGSIDTAVEAMKEGAFDYITKPILDKEIKIIIQRIFEQKRILDENKFLKKKLERDSRHKFYDITGQNYKMRKIYNLIETVAPTNANVLIQGQSGTGKRLVAHAIHSSDSIRKDKAFIEVSCGALPETLLESELFGHVRGAFTSAVKDRQGRFEVADGGTIFLDEIDAFSLKLQVKLLRVLQEGEFEKVGDTKTIKVNVRLIAATNQDLRQLIKQGLFREDLYYRLNVIPLDIPPLKERLDDLPLLVEHFLHKCSKKINKDIKDISDEAMEALNLYEWPGNVRELENVIERATILCKGRVVEKEDLPDSILEMISPSAAGSLRSRNAAINLKDALRSSEKAIIMNALEQCSGNRKKAAHILGINRTTLYNKMREYCLLKNN